MSIHFLKRKFIPTHNADLTAIEELKNISFDISGPYAIEILEWIQNPNWVVTNPIINYFQPYKEKLKEEFLYILNLEDSRWKKVILEAFILDWEKEQLPSNLLSKLQQMAYSPSLSETQYQLDLLAQLKLEENTTEQLNSIRFEIKLSREETTNDIWPRLMKSFPLLEQLSSGIGQIQIDSSLEELQKTKFELIKNLLELQKNQSDLIHSILSRYHSNKP